MTTPFTSAADARDVGGPVLRLHRAALGRDPDAPGLAALVAACRRGAPMAELAYILAGTAEFAALHGPGAPDDPVDDATARRIARNAFTTDDPAVPGLAAAMAGLSRAETAAAIADAAPVRARSPLLPGLFPDVPPDDPVAYAFWVAAHDTSPKGLSLPPLDGPRVTLAMAAGDSEAEAALRTLASLQAQLYPDWELCLATRMLSPWPARTLARAAEAEPRLRLLPGPGGLEGLNAALAARTGALAGCVQPGDTLPPTALWEVVQAWAAHPNPALLYTDEDQAGPDGARHSPRFKPAYSALAHQAGIPVGALAFYAAALLDQVGGLLSGRDGPPGPDPHHALALRAAALAGPGAVLHLPAVLLHRAAAPPSTAPSPAAPSASRTAPAPPGPAAAHQPAHAAPDRTQDPGPAPGNAATHEPPPRTTVILLTKDRADLLAASTSGIAAEIPLGAPDGNELLIVDNGSTDPDALALLDQIAARPGVRVLRRPGPFNFAALNNDAAREAHGDILLLLNNDMEMPEPGWWHALARHATQPGVGIAGARLLYRDGTLQHGGMVLGPAGRAVHVLRGAQRDTPGYEGQLAVPRDVSAVTGACMAIPRAVWEQVGGMNEDLPVAWNDVDLCQRVRAAGFRVVWTPDAVLLHLEGETRGRDAADPARQAQFLADAARYRATWGAAADEDPYLNPNLFATDHALVLAPPRRPRPWAVHSAATPAPAAAHPADNVIPPPLPLGEG